LWKNSAPGIHSNFPASEAIFQMMGRGLDGNERPNRSKHLFANCVFSRELSPSLSEALEPVTLRKHRTFRSLCRFSPLPPSLLITHEKDLPTKGSSQKASSRIPPSNAHSRRTSHDQESSAKGPEATRCLTTNPSVTLETFVESCLTGNVVASAGSSWSVRQARPDLLVSASSSRGVADLPCSAIESRDVSAQRPSPLNCNQELTT
jgi:hypothetical protein